MRLFACVKNRVSICGFGGTQSEQQQRLSDLSIIALGRSAARMPGQVRYVAAADRPGKRRLWVSRELNPSGSSAQRLSFCFSLSAYVLRRLPSCLAAQSFAALKVLPCSVLRPHADTSIRRFVWLHKYESAQFSSRCGEAVRTRMREFWYLSWTRMKEATFRFIALLLRAEDRILRHLEDAELNHGSGRNFNLLFS